MSTCPICQSTNQQRFTCPASFTYGSKHDLLECIHCGTYYFNPIPSLDEFVTFYSIGGYSFERWRQESKADAFLRRLNKKQASGNFLDVGCATGYLIHRIQQVSDWQVYGIELSELAVNFARNTLGLKNIINNDLLSANYEDEFFDFIHIGDVLEHVPNPVQILAECKRILKPDGIIHLAIPNGFIDSRGLIHYYKKYNEAGCHGSGHIFFFPPRALTYLTDKVGLQIRSSRTVGIKNGLRSIGLLPRKRNWMKQFQPRLEAEVPHQAEITLIDKKKYPDFYYKYRNLKNNLLAIPGMHNFGIDLKLELNHK